MYILSESDVRVVASRELAFDAVRESFIASFNGSGHLFPVVIARGCDEGNTFSIKSASMDRPRLSGLKIGSYWASNTKKGLPNHSSMTVLLDEETGFVRALVSARYLNCLRTAAANAVAVSSLARENAHVLGVLGAGNQSVYEIEAVCQVRNIRKVLINSRTMKSVENAISRLHASRIDAEYRDCESICRSADILVTVTNSTTPLFKASWIKSGTHISAMGADQSGKQELPLSLVKMCRLFADNPEQSRAVGEFEVACKSDPDLEIIPIGAVLSGDTSGRESDTQITVFDSSGIALQDVCVANAVLSRAILKNIARKLEI